MKRMISLVIVIVAVLGVRGLAQSPTDPIVLDHVIGGSNGTSANFNQPVDVVVAPDGRAFVSDMSRDEIQVFDRNGQFLYSFGSRGIGPGQFRQPHGMALDGLGRLAVCDSGNDRIQLFELDGTFVFEFGNGPQAFFQPMLNRPRGIASVGDSYYVADTNNGRIAVFREQGAGAFIQSGSFGAPGNGPGQFNDVWDVERDSLGRLVTVERAGRGAGLHLGR